MSEKDLLTLVIQAGGQSSRMGQDKARMLFLGQPLIARLVERLAGLAGEVLVTTNRLDDYAFLDLTLVPDLLPGTGALGGLYTALSAAHAPYVMVVACDMPFVRPDLLRAQYGLLLQEEADAVIPRTPNGLEPLHAVYRRETCLPAVRAALDSGARRMIDWLPAVKARIMEPAEVAAFDPEYFSFINVNDPEELRRAEDLARRSSGG